MVQWKITLLAGNPFPAPMIMGGNNSSKQCSFGDFFIKIRPPCFGCVNGVFKLPKFHRLNHSVELGVPHCPKQIAEKFIGHKYDLQF